MNKEELEFIKRYKIELESARLKLYELIQNDLQIDLYDPKNMRILVKLQEITNVMWLISNTRFEDNKPKIK